MFRWQPNAIFAIAAVMVCGWSAALAEAEDIFDRLESANERFSVAFAARDASALGACYTTDAQLFPAGTDVVTGRANIEARFRKRFGGPVKGVTLITLEAEQHGDTAIEVGRAEFFGASGEKLNTAKYIVIWKRIDGDWKMHRDILNSNAPPRPEG